MRLFARRVSALAKRTSRAARDPLREAALTLACEDDKSLVLRFASFARQRYGDRVFNDGAFKSLNMLCNASALGKLPSAVWASHLDDGIPTVDAAPIACRETRKEHWSTLLAALQNGLPINAHEERLRRAIGLLSPHDSSTADTNAALCILIEGADRGGLPSLQHELLDRFRNLAASEGFGLSSFVQEPLLKKLGVPEADALPTLMPHLDAAGNPDAAFVRVSEMECVLAAAHLARRGDQHGAQHGCIVVEHPPSSSDADKGRLLGAGWNHYQKDSAKNKKRRLVHAEVHALTDAIAKRGEEGAFDAFTRSTVWIVELLGEVGYDDAFPCPKCEGMLRATGLREVRHTSGAGRITTRRLGPPLPHLLEGEHGPISPLRINLREERGIRCTRLGG